MAILLIVDETFQSGLKRWSDQQTDRLTLLSIWKEHKLSDWEVHWKKKRKERTRGRQRKQSWLEKIESSSKCREETAHKHPGVYEDKQTAQVATLSEISTWFASTGGPLSDANDCRWRECRGWYWCAGAAGDAVPHSPSTASFSNKLTLKKTQSLNK